MKRNIVVAITGASGVTYSVRLIEVLLAAGCDVHLCISAAAQVVLREELGLTVDLDHFDPAMLMLGSEDSHEDPKLQSLQRIAGISSEASNVLGMETGTPGTIYYHHFADCLAPIASGSFLTDGMVVCPCTGGTLSAIANGASLNLIHRAAEVHLKERRKLILVPRETPLSLVHLRNMTAVAEAGGVILPAMPGLYHGVKLIGDLVDFVVSRICDQFGIPNTLIERWGEPTSDESVDG
jgi:flavin prenyltransferase